jgi:hypothetical protein
MDIKICCGCKSKRELDFFIRDGKEYKTCNKCSDRRNKNKKNKNDLTKKNYEEWKKKNPLHLKFRKMINDSKKEDIKRDRFNESEFVDIDYLVKVFEIQGGKCIYCDCELSLIFTLSNIKNKISLQRINNDYGHNKMNSVFCCSCCNYSRKELIYDISYYDKVLSKV